MIQYEERLDKVHPALAKLVREVAKVYPLLVICGERGKAAQDEAYHAGKSNHRWPSSKHNIQPPDTVAFAVDVAPLPLDWRDKERFYYLGGYMMATAKRFEIKLRWGGDWDNDYDLHDQKLYDLVHYEIIEEW
jgi:peptidoglycan LD-endopeptidase CwlK